MAKKETTPSAPPSASDTNGAPPAPPAPLSALADVSETPTSPVFPLWLGPAGYTIYYSGMDKVQFNDAGEYTPKNQREQDALAAYHAHDGIFGWVSIKAIETSLASALASSQASDPTE